MEARAPRGRGPLAPAGRAARSLWGGGGAQPGTRPLSLPGPVYSPERCKCVSSSRRAHLFLHLLLLLV